MSNRLRGETEITGASGQTYVVKLGSAAICELEEKLDRPVLTLYNDLNEGTMHLRTVRAFLVAAGIPKPDEAQANEIIDDAGIMPLLQVLTDSLLVTFNLKTEEKKKATKSSGTKDSKAPRK